MLRKKDLVEVLGVAKSTVADWISEFQVFIPIIKEGALTYYKPESVNVLQTIKTMREQNMPKSEIYAVLQQRGFPITISEAEEDVQKVLGKLDARKQLLDVMNQVGNALERLADQEETIEHIEKRQDALSDQQKFLSERQDEADGRVTELEQLVHQLEEKHKTELERIAQKFEQELEAARMEIASTKAELENRKKPWWKIWR
ncbi:MerR-like DNA binding protein [Alicyclobacillus sacchari]|uniref:MerR-like DNA binding protein n=2 Tax=Alicyclobacillus sacchari TaxID=392010 RepID=A0A4R8L889_9BACL|nr:MerR-like DNA binding protein [Alicyclobacillus sacchari]